jgi:hypothetical protein
VLGLAACHDSTSAPRTANTVTVLSGGGQSAAAGTALPSPLTVKVVDQYGNAVPNAMVTFSDDASGTFASATVTTDASGMASDTITLGTSAGVDDVTASIQTASGAVTVTLHETAS